MNHEHTENATREDQPESLVAFRPWRELAAGTYILMELSWVALWYRALIHPSSETSYLWIFAVFISIVVSTYVVAWIMNFLYINLRTRRIIFVCIILANTFWGIKALLFAKEKVSLGELINSSIIAMNDWTRLLPIEFLIILLVLVLSWRGASLASKYVAPDQVIGGFRTGILMFLGYGALMMQNAPPPGIALNTFIVSSLIALSTSRIVILGQLRGGRNIPFDRRWFGGILFSAFLITGIAYLIFTLTQGERFRFLYIVFSWIISGLVILFSPLLWIFTKVLFWIGEVLRLDKIFDFFIDFFQSLKDLVQSALTVMRNLFPEAEPEQVERALNVIRDLRALVILGSILIFAVIVILSVKRFITRSREATEDEFQSLLDEQDLFGQLREAIRKGMEKLIEGMGRALQLPLTRQILAAARIRRVYARLMRLSAKLENPRPPSRTPLEFLPSLNKLFPQHTLELETITNAYLRIRYGELPESSDEVEKVDRAWRRVSAIGQSMLKMREKHTS